MKPAADRWHISLSAACAFGWLFALTILAGPAQAHLMVAQKGTLNFSGTGAYLLLSLPVSSLTGVDDDQDQRLSMTELQAHSGTIERQVSSGVQLHEEGRPIPIEGLLLNLSPTDDSPDAPASQLVVMGRYATAATGRSTDGEGYRYTVNLYGQATGEQSCHITFTRHAKAHTTHFSPARREHQLFPSALSAFFKQVRSGAEHVLRGMDHLLFLMVAVTEMTLARRGWRQALLTLSAFTVGHALALAASTSGHVYLAPSLVEPAIAATIVVTAMVHLWQVHRARWHSNNFQLGLVFLCALIHGMGLASAMTDVGLGAANLTVAMIGFNLGIEFAQVSVATAAAAGVALFRWLGLLRQTWVAQIPPVLAALAGTAWLIERISGQGA